VVKRKKSLPLMGIKPGLPVHSLIIILDTVIQTLFSCGALERGNNNQTHVIKIKNI
jgi:hypothetical protein